MGWKVYTPETHGKWSLRASATGELVFDNVKIQKQYLPNKDGLGAPLGCLDSARYGIAWGALALLWIVMILLCVIQRAQFGNQLQDSNCNKRNWRNDYRNN